MEEVEGVLGLLFELFDSLVEFGNPVLEEAEVVLLAESRLFGALAQSLVFGVGVEEVVLRAEKASQAEGRGLVGGLFRFLNLLEIFKFFLPRKYGCTYSRSYWPPSTLRREVIFLIYAFLTLPLISWMGTALLRLALLVILFRADYDFLIFLFAISGMN